MTLTPSALLVRRTTALLVALSCISTACGAGGTAEEVLEREDTTADAVLDGAIDDVMRDGGGEDVAPAGVACPACRPDGARCNTDEACCNARCDVVTGMCVGCLPDLRRCEVDGDCCGGRCRNVAEDGRETLCISCAMAGDACGTSEDCCGNLPCNLEGRCGCSETFCDGDTECCGDRICWDGACRRRLPCGAPCAEDRQCVYLWCNQETGLCDCRDSIQCGCETPCSWPRFCNAGCFVSGFCWEELQCDALSGECILQSDELSDGMPCAQSQSCLDLCDPQTHQCASCLALGNACTGDDACCSGLCDDGRCVGCVEDGRPCESDGDCCSEGCGPRGVCAACAG